MKRFLEIDADGTVEIFHFDPLMAEVVIERQHNVNPVLESNKAKATSHDGFSPSRELREVAEIPMGVVELWKQVYGVDLFNRDHWPAVKRLLRDPDFRFMRSSPGQI